MAFMARFFQRSRRSAAVNATASIAGTVTGRPARGVDGHQRSGARPVLTIPVVDVAVGATAESRTEAVGLRRGPVVDHDPAVAPRLNAIRFTRSSYQFVTGVPT